MNQFVSLVPLLLMGAFLYFFMIRPQQKAAKEKQDMLGSLKRGDHVVTIGGLHGLVDEVLTSEDRIVLDCEGVYLTFERMAIARLLNSSVHEEEAYVEEVEVEIEEPVVEDEVEVTEVIIDEPSDEE